MSIPTDFGTATALGIGTATAGPFLAVLSPGLVLTANTGLMVAAGISGSTVTVGTLHALASGVGSLSGLTALTSTTALLTYGAGLSGAFIQVATVNPSTLAITLGSTVAVGKARFTVPVPDGSGGWLSVAMGTGGTGRFTTSDVALYAGSGTSFTITQVPPSFADPGFGIYLSLVAQAAGAASLVWTNPTATSHTSIAQVTGTTLTTTLLGSTVGGPPVGASNPAGKHLVWDGSHVWILDPAGSVTASAALTYTSSTYAAVGGAFGALTPIATDTGLTLTVADTAAALASLPLTVPGLPSTVWRVTVVPCGTGALLAATSSADQWLAFAPGPTVTPTVTGLRQYPRDDQLVGGPSRQRLGGPGSPTSRAASIRQGWRSVVP